MPAKNRDDLLDVTRTEFAKLSKLLDSVSDELADHCDPTDKLSIKQIIGHRVHWIDLFFG